MIVKSGLLRFSAECDTCDAEFPQKKFSRFALEETLRLHGWKKGPFGRSVNEVKCVDCVSKEREAKRKAAARVAGTTAAIVGMHRRRNRVTSKTNLQVRMSSSELERAMRKGAIVKLDTGEYVDSTMDVPIRIILDDKNYGGGSDHSSPVRTSEPSSDHSSSGSSTSSSSSDSSPSYSSPSYSSDSGSSFSGGDAGGSF